MLKRLPQSIGNIQNLIILDLSYNKLMYLPVAIIHLQNLLYLDISMNPFSIHELHMQYRIRVQNLVKLSANIVLQYRFVSIYHTNTHTHQTRVCTQKSFFSYLSFFFTYLLCYTIFCL